MKCNVLKIAKQMVKTNQDIIEELCTKMMVSWQSVMKIKK